MYSLDYTNKFTMFALKNLQFELFGEQQLLLVLNHIFFKYIQKLKIGL